MTTFWIVASIWEKQDPALKRGVPQKSAGEGVEGGKLLEEVPREQFRRRVPEERILKEFPNRTVQGRLPKGELLQGIVRSPSERGMRRRM